MSNNNNITKKTQDIYQIIIDRLIREIKDVATSEGCSEDTLKELKSVRENINNYLYIFSYGKEN
jgi:hypothetical protein